MIPGRAVPKKKDPILRNSISLKDKPFKKSCHLFVAGIKAKKPGKKARNMRYREVSLNVFITSLIGKFLKRR